MFVHNVMGMGGKYRKKLALCVMVKVPWNVEMFFMAR
jgi:hypothetical protein